MPTKPSLDFIPRDIHETEFQEILDEYSSVLEELVNFASHVAKWCSEKIHGGEELAPIMLSFRHIIELIDAISVLVKYACIEPCKILLRAVFESVLNVNYILEKDTEKRGIAFMTCCWHQAINNLRKLNPKDSMHKQFLAKKRKDKFSRNVPLPKIPDVKERIKVLEDHLASPEYIESEREFQRLKSIIKRKRKESPKKTLSWHLIFRWIKNIIEKKTRETPKKRLNWYSMYQGPANLEALANYLELPIQYDVFYREWSGLAHGTNIIINNIEVVDKNRSVISQIRLPEDAYDITYTALNYGLEIIPKYIEMFVPEKAEVAKAWYSDEIVPLKNTVLKKNRIIVKSPEH